MTLLSQVKFSQNVLYHMKDDFLLKKANHKTITLAGFLQRGSEMTPFKSLHMHYS